MALLAFPVDVTIVPYAVLFDISRWDDLIEQFRQENYRLFQLSSQSVFTVTLQAGLSALKTPYPFYTNVLLVTCQMYETIFLNNCTLSVMPKAMKIKILLAQCAMKT